MIIHEEKHSCHYKHIQQGKEGDCTLTLFADGGKVWSYMKLTK